MIDQTEDFFQTIPVTGPTPIICLSSQNWHNELWTNKQHIMSRLAQRGWPIIYVNKGGSTWWNYLRLPFARSWDCKGITREGHNLYCADSPRLLFVLLNKNWRCAYEFGHKIRRLSSLLHHDPAPIVWIYHPGYGHYLHLVPDQCMLVYDCVDDYATFPALNRPFWKDWVRSGEEKILQRADVVFASSRALYDDKKRFNSNTHYVHNVGDFDHFHRADTHDCGCPAEIASAGPKIGFFGALSSYKVDMELLLEIAAMRPDWDIYLMGPVGVGDNSTRVKDLRRRANIHLCGRIPYQKLPQYLRYMDVLTIPYRITPHTQHVFPIKFFECLATGKPLVMTPLPSVREFKKYVRFACNAPEFCIEIEKALSENGPQDKPRRLAVARRNSWDKRVAAMMLHVEKVRNSRSG